MRWFMFALALVVWTGGISADLRAAPKLPDLTGPVILTVIGLDPSVFPGGTIAFDAARLKAMGESQLRTSTIWTEGVHDFTGVLLKDLVDYLGLKDGMVKAVALNDYAVDIPTSDATPDGPIMAYAIDNVPMSVREKGPLWIVYPFDAKPEYRSEIIYTRAIWQLVRLEVYR